MKKSRFSEEQIVGILKQAEAGRKTEELCREHGISPATFYTWRSKYGGLELSEAKRLKVLEEENRTVKCLAPARRTEMELTCFILKLAFPF